MHITLINPNNVTQKNDVHGTGIPYMPIMLASLASYLLHHEHAITVIDAFGEAPDTRIVDKKYIIKGLSAEDIITRIPAHTALICIYAAHVAEHCILINIIDTIKQALPAIKICMIENAQAVTAYALSIAYHDFFTHNVEFIITGDPEHAVLQLINTLQGTTLSLSNIPGLLFKKDGQVITNTPAQQLTQLDGLPFPAWDLFPVHNYWKIGFSHAPFTGPYIPLLTSRGCPFDCTFCIMPHTSQKQWHARTPAHIVAEIKHWMHVYGVKDFHIEDVNPTLDTARMKQLASLIISEKLQITFKFASGIKLETLDEETLTLLARAGCVYVSFSPESGSPAILQKMNKPFDHAHGITMTRLMHRLGVTTQACFVIGFTDETDADRKQTFAYIRTLTRAGIDEIALFVMTPIPGSKPYAWEHVPTEKLSCLTFSPEWRNEYKKLDRFRTFVYYSFLLIKLAYHPLKVVKHAVRLMQRTFDTKIEMTLYRLCKTHF